MLLSQISKTGDHIIYKKVHFYPLVMNIRKLNEETDSIYKNIKKKIHKNKLNDWISSRQRDSAVIFA
jgi:predicted GTPase